MWGLIFIWALIQSYAQVYVGVHFPTDVFCGIIVGLIIGYVSGKLFNNQVALMLPETDKKLWQKS